MCKAHKYYGVKVAWTYFHFKEGSVYAGERGMFKDICYLASSVTVPRMCWWTMPLDSVCLLRNPLANGDDVWFERTLSGLLTRLQSWEEWLKLTKCRLSTSILRRESRNAKNKRFHRWFERILDSIIWIWIWSLSVKPWTQIPNHFWRRQKEQWQIPLCSIYNVPFYITGGIQYNLLLGRQA